MNPIRFQLDQSVEWLTALRFGSHWPASFSYSNCQTSHSVLSARCTAPYRHSPGCGPGLSWIAVPGEKRFRPDRTLSGGPVFREILIPETCPVLSHSSAAAGFSRRPQLRLADDSARRVGGLAACSERTAAPCSGHTP